MQKGDQVTIDITGKRIPGSGPDAEADATDAEATTEADADASRRSAEGEELRAGRTGKVIEPKVIEEEGSDDDLHRRGLPL